MRCSQSEIVSTDGLRSGTRNSLKGCNRSACRRVSFHASDRIVSPQGAVRADERAVAPRSVPDEHRHEVPISRELYVPVRWAARPGVFAAGDVRSGSVKRVASAVGEGAMVVMLVREYLNER